MSGLRPTTRALLDRAARAHEPDHIDRQRVRARIARRLAMGVAAASTVSAASKTLTAGAATGTGLFAKAVVSLALVGTVVAGTTTLVSQSGTLKTRFCKNAATMATPPAKPVQTSAPPEPEPSPPDIESTPPSPAPVLPAVPTASKSIVRAPRKEAAAPEEEARPSFEGPVAFAVEVDLLARAHQALSTENGTLALALLEEHGRRFPKSALVEEREAVRIFALCAGGQSLEAAREAKSFLQGYPNSPLADRVRASCTPP